MYERRIQTLPPMFWTNKPLHDQNTYVFSYVNGVQMITKVESPKTALDAIKRAESKGIAAFAATPIPCNNNQNGVFAFSAVDVLEEYKTAKNVNAMIATACHSVFCEVITETKAKQDVPQKTPVVKAPAKPDKEDPQRIIVVVNYAGSTKPYNFRARKWHFPGEYVCVKTNDELKNVKVIECKAMKESEVKELARSIGYDDISEVYCDEPIELKKPTIIPEAEEEIEYEEDMNELLAMREAFAPVCDYVSNPHPNGYTYDDPCDGEPIEDYDDLPD